MAEKKFIGRNWEHSKLKQRIFLLSPNEVSGNTSASLTGPPGIGKKTLIREAIRRFNLQNHDGVYLVKQSFCVNDTAASFLYFLMMQLQKKLNESDFESKHSGRAESLDQLKQCFNQASELDFRDGTISSKLSELFQNAMEQCYLLSIRIVLILFDFDNIKQMKEEDQRELIGFLDNISERTLRSWYLSILLVSEIQPQFIANPVLSGSRFQEAYPPIPLHNYDNQEMECYFSTLPPCTDEQAVHQAILQCCGRYPLLLDEFRSSVSGLDLISEDQVSLFTRRTSKTALFHRLRTMLMSQYVDANDSITALSAFQRYFFDGVHRGSQINTVFNYGLVDMVESGGRIKYYPPTEFCTQGQSDPNGFLAYLSAGDAPSEDGTPDPGSPRVIASWLHLSDLHVSNELDTQVLLNQFQALSTVITPDFLVVTGDFRDKTSGTDYSLANDYLLKIMSYFRIQSENVYLVPGNHDAENAAAGLQKTIGDITSNTEDNYNFYSRHLSELYARFSAYDSFCKNIYRNVRDERFEHPCATKLCVWNGKLNLICLNTALLSDGNRDHRELLDLAQINRLINQCDPHLPIIILGHHGLSSFYQSHLNRFAQLCRNKASAYLHGDIHRSAIEVGFTCTPSNVVPSFSCGKSTPKSGDATSDVGAVFYEWKDDGNVYVRWFRWNPESRNLYEDLSHSPSLGSNVSFPIVRGV